MGAHGWILWWEAIVCHIVKFMRGWGRMMAQQWLEEVHIFLEEDLHNVTLQEEAAKLEMVVHAEVRTILPGVLRFVQIFSGFRREMRAPSSILTSSRGRWLLIGCLVYVGLMVLLPRTLLRSEVCFSLHFQNIFAPYA
jgi:hypothetical protein